MRWTTATHRAREKAVADRLRRSSKFYVFLWSVREELFDNAFQNRLIAVYQPRGQESCPPALLAMVMLLQRFDGLSDADAVDEAENDQQWKLVLGTLDQKRAPFGQGSVVRFRTKAIEHDLDKKLVERNLIGRAMAKVVSAVAKATGVEENTVIEGAKLTVLNGPSIKAAIDIDWGDDEGRHEALQRLVGEAERLETSVVRRMKGDAAKPPVSDALTLLRRVVGQDLEPEPEGGGGG